jgi:hypothetical protein
MRLEPVNGARWQRHFSPVVNGARRQRHFSPERRARARAPRRAAAIAT